MNDIESTFRNPSRSVSHASSVFKKRTIAKAIGLVALLGAAGAAQAADCTGVNVYPNWTASDWSGGQPNHSNPGDQLVHQNALYSANWYTATTPGSDPSWSLLGSC
ncbi:MAG: acetyl xylan esterase, partial [Alteromonadaceae bacterium]